MISTEFTLGCCCPTQQRLWSPLQHKLSFLEAKCEKHNRIQKDKRTPNAFNRDVQWWGLNWVYFAECTQRSPFCFFFPMATQRTSCAETLQKTHLTSAGVSRAHVQHSLTFLLPLFERYTFWNCWDNENRNWSIENKRKAYAPCGRARPTPRQGREFACLHESCGSVEFGSWGHMAAKTKGPTYAQTECCITVSLGISFLVKWFIDPQTLNAALELVASWG